MARATDIGDEVMEGTIPSLILDSLESIQKAEVLSPEDSAWVDSCLISESDVSDDNWSSLRGALPKILNSQPESPSSSAIVSDGLPGETDIEILPSSEGAETERIQSRSRNALLSIYEEAERSDDDMPTNEDTSKRNPVLPGYNDDLRVTDTLELEANIGYSVPEMEPSTVDIFRVWDLDVPGEEDELVKQLDKALEESLPQSVSSTFDESDIWKNLKVDSVDVLFGSKFVLKYSFLYIRSLLYIVVAILIIGFLFTNLTETLMRLDCVKKHQSTQLLEQGWFLLEQICMKGQILT